MTMLIGKAHVAHTHFTLRLLMQQRSLI